MPRPRAGVIWVEIEGQVVAVDAEGERVHRLSEEAALLWQCIDGATTLEQLSADVADAFSLPRDRSRADVARFADELVALRLVDPPDSGAQA